MRTIPNAGRLVIVSLLMAGTFVLPASAAEKAAAADAPVLRKKPTGAPGESGAGCTWLARRVLLSIVREDIVASNDWVDLFKGFSCDTEHLQRSFDCVASQPISKEAEKVDARIEACWANPYLLPSPPVGTPAQPDAKPDTKPDTQPTK